MRIETLTLENWRNIESLSLDFSPGIQLIVGANAQGKTNILEALGMLSTLHSFRTGKEQMLLRQGQDRARITAVFEKKGRVQILEVHLEKDKPKRIFLDGRQILKVRDGIGLFSSVLFTPDHLMMIKGAPGERREFLDVALCAASPKYTELLLQYNKALKNRNRVLKSENASLLETLCVWDDMLAGYGSEIAYMRAEYIELLDGAAAEEYARIAVGGEKLKIVYLNQLAKDKVSVAEYRSLMLKALEKRREKDIEAGATGVGIHKDDFLALLSGKSAKFFGSQGQIRSVVLAMKMAEAKITEQKTGEAPVILLDDILSELDESRQKYILEHTFENQCIVTACEPEKLTAFSASCIKIKGGKADVSVPRG